MFRVNRFRLMDPNADAGAGGAPPGGAPAAPAPTGGAPAGGAAPAAGAPAPSGGASPAAGGAAQITPADARAFVGSVYDPELVKTWNDDQFVKEHTRLNGALDKVRPKAPAAPATWPEDWREKYSAADATKLETLKRYASPQAALDALFAAREKISKGVKLALPADATPEQITEFRKANGVPEKPEEYKLALTEGRVVGEVDKPVIDKLLADLHGLHTSPAIASKVVDFYYATIEDQIAQRQNQDALDKESVEETLRQEYGTDYKRNIALVRNFLEAAGGRGGDSVAATLLNARAANGTLLFNNPGLIRTMTQWARDANPTASFLPGGDEAASASIEAEINATKTLMADKNSAYWKGPESQKKQERYRELLSIQEKVKQRRAA